MKRIDANCLSRKEILEELVRLGICKAKDLKKACREIEAHQERVVLRAS
ncbi:MAG: hypothetical protein U9P80_00175 [Thermodesulfobacteriota bacterium]|nr:hypothetical protein [Thermodesulfobacteriota bacterium]